jgi:uncharacterized membrane protein
MSGLKILKALAARPRLLIGFALAAVGYVVLSHYLRASQAVLLAFDLGAAFFLISIARVMSRATTQAMRLRAERQSYGRWTVILLSVLTIGMVMLALHDELRAGKAQAAHSVAFAGLSIVLSWLFLATNFAQEYAHEYALNRHNHAHSDGGLLFPGTPEPEYWDFMYFSLILSMACQTADVQITDGAMRRLALLHSVMAFFFNVVIISITINTLSGVL